MNKLCMLLLGVAVLPVCLYGTENKDSLSSAWEKEFDLEEVVVVANRPVLKQAPDKIIYLIQNDPYALGLNAIQVLDRIPRISVTNDKVNVAGKNSVKYIIDGHLLEMPDEAIELQLKNLQSSGIEKIELLTTPPAKYASTNNVAYVSITTKNERLGTRGNIWGNATVRESISYLLGGNISHSTRRFEMSADMSWQDLKGINDLNREYLFKDYQITSNRSNHFKNRAYAANALLKYKFTNSINAGVIFNFSTIGFSSMLHDTSNIRDESYISDNISPSCPNNAITVTAFSDWNIDSQGKMLSLTYNFFNRKIKSKSDITSTLLNDGVLTHVTNEGNNDYSIQSVKLDANLPFPFLKMEAGASFTGIDNTTRLDIYNFTNTTQNSDRINNSFKYNEKTGAVYMSAERNYINSFFTKLGLRYEYTQVEGYQAMGEKRHNKHYGYLIPYVTLSWNSMSIGRYSLSYSMGITRPNFNDLNPFRYYTTSTDYYTGNPDLNPSIAHNLELSYNFRGLYAVLYSSFNRNAVAYITRFITEGNQITMPENCLNTNKTGLYASYNRSLWQWWNIKIGGEVFHTYSKSKLPDYVPNKESKWSGKLELNSSWMLNRPKTLILNLRFSHYFPWQERMVKYSSISLIGADLRYSLLNNRLTLALSLNDPFGWNNTKSKTRFSDYTMISHNNIHSHAVILNASWTFGRTKVNNVYRDTKERESHRSN